jgi:hypothetical protein
MGEDHWRVSIAHHPAQPPGPTSRHRPVAKPAIHPRAANRQPSPVDPLAGLRSGRSTRRQPAGAFSDVAGGVTACPACRYIGYAGYRTSEEYGMDPSANFSPSESDKLQKDLLWAFYLEWRTAARHVETTRSNAINYALLVSAALITVITVDKQVTRSDWPLCVVLLSVSLFTSVYSLSYLERYLRNKKRAEVLMEEIDARFFRGQPEYHHVTWLRTKSDRLQRHETPFLAKIKGATVATHGFWIVVPIIIFLLSCLLLYQALTTA